MNLSNYKIPKEEKIFNIPNSLTLARGAISTYVAGIIALSGPSIEAAIILGGGFLTDLFDGKAARFFHQETEFGKRLDPVVDAYSYITIVSALAYSTPDATQRNVLIGVLLFTIGYIAHMGTEWNKLGDLQDEISASRIGKWKTGVSMIAITTLSATSHVADTIHQVANILGTVGIAGGAILTGACWRDYYTKSRELLAKLGK